MGIYEGFKDAISIAQKADNVDLYKRLLDLSAQALDMQEEIRQLKAENAELKKAQEIEAKIERHTQPYVSLNDDPMHIKYCSTCWSNQHKLIQLSPFHGNHYHCGLCNANYIITGDNSL